MTDRELLELAAKAAGIEVERSRLTDPAHKDMLIKNSFRNPFQSYGPWNPLTDDGDALRLSVQCKIDVKHYDGYVVAWFDAFFGTGRIAYNGDPCAATRRAIVLAAAEIGKQGGDKP